MRTPESLRAPAIGAFDAESSIAPRRCGKKAQTVASGEVRSPSSIWGMHAIYIQLRAPVLTLGILLDKAQKNWFADIPQLCHSEHEQNKPNSIQLTIADSTQHRLHFSNHSGKLGLPIVLVSNWPKGKGQSEETNCSLYYSQPGLRPPKYHRSYCQRSE